MSMKHMRDALSESSVGERAQRTSYSLLTEGESMDA